jgi:hypothetical protein
MRVAHWPWPLPALLAWALAWGLFLGLHRLGLSAWAGFGLACGVGVLCSLWGQGMWRRLLIAAGFPLSMALAGGLALPAWAWLLPLGLLLLLYPLQAWRDAPLFPTPLRALQGLAQAAPLPDGALVLDAGCGLGHGLRALRLAYPQARLHGLEWSWPLRLLCALRCPWAGVRRGDIWAEDWRPYALVYLFQRPETMPRAMSKAQAEMAPGSWLVSLEFEAVDWRPKAVLHVPDGRPLWLYQLPLQARGGGASPSA